MAGIRIKRKEEYVHSTTAGWNGTALTLARADGHDVWMDSAHCGSCIGKEKKEKGHGRAEHAYRSSIKCTIHGQNLAGNTIPVRLWSSTRATGDVSWGPGEVGRA